jgi:hypothetical protein
MNRVRSLRNDSGLIYLNLKSGKLIKSGTHGSLRQWQVSVQLYPNCPCSHATN